MPCVGEADGCPGGEEPRLVAQPSTRVSDANGGAVEMAGNLETSVHGRAESGLRGFVAHRYDALGQTLERLAACMASSGSKLAQSSSDAFALPPRPWTTGAATVCRLMRVCAFDIVFMDGPRLLETPGHACCDMCEHDVLDGTMWHCACGFAACREGDARISRVLRDPTPAILTGTCRDEECDEDDGGDKEGGDKGFGVSTAFVTSKRRPWRRRKRRRKCTGAHGEDHKADIADMDPEIQALLGEFKICVQ